MGHSYKERYYYTSYLWRKYNCADSGDGRGGVDPRITHFYHPKYNYDRYRHDGDFQKSQRQHTAPPTALFRSRDYPIGTSDGSLFNVSVGDGKGGVVPRTTHLSTQNFYFWIDGDNFVLSRSR